MSQLVALLSMPSESTRIVNFPSSGSTWCANGLSHSTMPRKSGHDQIVSESNTIRRQIWIIVTTSTYPNMAHISRLRNQENTTNPMFIAAAVPGKILFQKSKAPAAVLYVEPHHSRHGSQASLELCRKGFMRSNNAPCASKTIETSQKMFKFLKGTASSRVHSITDPNPSKLHKITITAFALFDSRYL